MRNIKLIISFFLCKFIPVAYEIYTCLLVDAEGIYSILS